MFVKFHARKTFKKSLLLRMLSLSRIDFHELAGTPPHLFPVAGSASATCFHQLLICVSLWSFLSVENPPKMVVYKDMVLTLLILAFTATCMADEMKSMKDEIAVIRNLLKVQTEKLTRLKMENDALKITVSKLENDYLLMKDRLMDISDENKVLQHEVTNLRRQVTQMQSLLKHGNVANVNEQEEPNGTLRETAIRRKLV